VWPLYAVLFADTFLIAYTAPIAYTVLIAIDGQVLQRKYHNRFTKYAFCGIFRGVSTVVTNIRIDKELKAQATELFNDLGLTLSQAFTVFLKQAILHHGLPFAVTRPPSKELLEAIKEGEELAHDPNAKTYASFDELLDELDIKV
jgi:DNA-damage-inducible protein J